MSELWTVKQNTGQHEGRRLFEGLETEARAYVEKNFPRPHIEPGAGTDELKADVHLISPDGVKEHFLGEMLENPWEFVDKDTSTDTTTTTTKTTTRGGVNKNA